MGVLVVGKKRIVTLTPKLPFVDPAIKHVHFVVPAKGEGMPSPQRLTGVRHWILAFAGMTNLKNLNIFSCRLNDLLQMPNTNTGAALQTFSVRKPRQMAICKMM